jgi:hypothetical protein
MKGRFLRSALALLVALAWTASGASNSSMDQYVECLNTGLVPHATTFEEIKKEVPVRYGLLTVAGQSSIA